MLTVECVIGINADYYSVRGDKRIGTSYTIDKADLLLQRIRESGITDVEIIRGRNVFANRPLTDEEFNLMKSKLAEGSGE